MGCLVSSIKEFKDRLKGNLEDSFITVSKKIPKAAAWRRKMKTVKQREKDAVSVRLSWRPAMSMQAALRKE